MAIAEKVRTVSVNKLHPVIGAEIKGVDLSRPLDEETVRQIKDAWYKHTVLVFRGQKLSEEDQRRFASYFGPVAKRMERPHADIKVTAPDWDDMMLITDNVDQDGKPIGALGHGEMWFHTDKCYRKRPHRASFLYGIEIPTEGGHTRFSSSYATYDRLPAELKRRFDDAMVLQGHEYSVGKRINLARKLEDIHHFPQPMVVTVPGADRKALYVASQNTMWIEGVDRDESEKILNNLFEMAEDPSIIYEHVWQVGDLLMWDNLACLHARTDWPSEQRRTLRRCTVEGDSLY
jgi:taurine dioxygenase